MGRNANICMSVYINLYVSMNTIINVSINADMILSANTHTCEHLIPRICKYIYKYGMTDVKVVSINTKSKYKHKYK